MTAPAADTFTSSAHMRSSSIATPRTCSKVRAQTLPCVACSMHPACQVPSHPSTCQVPAQEAVGTCRGG